jgi:hypothetical protein
VFLRRQVDAVNEYEALTDFSPATAPFIRQDNPGSFSPTNLADSATYHPDSPTGAAPTRLHRLAQPDPARSQPSPGELTSIFDLPAVPADRSQVRQDLDGGGAAHVQATPTTRSAPAPNAAIARTTFAGREYTDPVRLAQAMLDNWNAGARVFLDKELREELAAWLRDDVKDTTINQGIFRRLVPDGADSGSEDIALRLLIFTRHFLPDATPMFRGQPADASGLAVLYQRAAAEDLAAVKDLAALTDSVLNALSSFNCRLHPECRSSNGCRVLAQLPGRRRRLGSMMSSEQEVVSAAIGDDTAMRRSVQEQLRYAAISARFLAMQAMLDPPSGDALWQVVRTPVDDLPTWNSELRARSINEVDPDGAMILATLAIATTPLGQRLVVGERTQTEKARGVARKKLGRHVWRRAGLFALAGLLYTVALIAIDQQAQPDGWYGLTPQVEVLFALVGVVSALAILIVAGYLLGQPQSPIFIGWMRVLGFSMPLAITGLYEVNGHSPAPAFLLFYALWFPVLAEVFAIALDGRPGSALIRIPRPIRVVVAAIALIGFVALISCCGSVQLQALINWSFFADNPATELLDNIAALAFDWVGSLTSS